MLTKQRSNTLGALLNPRIGAMLVLGFASGLPLSLSGNTLQAWLTDSGVDIATIGLFSLIGLPYTIKFLWAPLLDRFRVPWLGRRRGWVLLTQLALVATIAAMAYGSPQQAPVLLAVLALLLAFLSASQDIVLDAYRTDVLRARERGLGAALWVPGYRLATWVSFSAVLILADRIGWSYAYLAMAAVMGVGIVGTLLAPEPEQPGVPPPTLQQAVIGPLTEFLCRPGALAMLALVVLYKLGDAFAGNLTAAFLLRGVGFSLTELGVIYKAWALVATLVGAVWAGLLMTRWSLYRSLMLFGILQAVTNLLFMVMAYSDRSYMLMVTVVGLENLAAGMGTAAFVALLMSQCAHDFSATQFALLTSLAALGRVLVGPAAGVLVDAFGWGEFFLVTTLAALPGLWLLYRLRYRLTVP